MCENCCFSLRLLACRVSSCFGRPDDAGLRLARGAGLRLALSKSRNPSAQRSRRGHVDVAHVDARRSRVGRPGRSGPRQWHFAVRVDSYIRSLQARSVRMDCPCEIIDRAASVGSASGTLLSLGRTRTATLIPSQVAATRLWILRVSSARSRQIYN
jgi:hypothetical protein